MARHFRGLTQRFNLGRESFDTPIQLQQFIESPAFFVTALLPHQVVSHQLHNERKKIHLRSGESNSVKYTSHPVGAERNVDEFPNVWMEFGSKTH